MGELEGLSEQSEINGVDEAIQIPLSLPLKSQILTHRTSLFRLIRYTSLLHSHNPTEHFQANHQANMTNENIAIVLVDPYNEFLHQDGKLNHMIRESLDKTNTIPNLHKLLAVARDKTFPIFYCLHQQSHAHSMQGWTMMNATLKGIKAGKVFEEGSWGVEFYDGMAPDAANGDVVVSKHWNSRWARSFVTGPKPASVD